MFLIVKDDDAAGNLWWMSIDESLFGSRGGFGGPVKAWQADVTLKQGSLGAGDGEVNFGLWSLSFEEDPSDSQLSRRFGILLVLEIDETPVTSSLWSLLSWKIDTYFSEVFLFFKDDVRIPPSCQSVCGVGRYDAKWLFSTLHKTFQRWGTRQVWSLSSARVRYLGVILLRLRLETNFLQYLPKEMRVIY